MQRKIQPLSRIKTLNSLRVCRISLVGKEKVYGGKDLPKSQVLSSEWKTERVREDISGFEVNLWQNISVQINCTNALTMSVLTSSAIWRTRRWWRFFGWWPRYKGKADTGRMWSGSIEVSLWCLINRDMLVHNVAIEHRCMPCCIIVLKNSCYRCTIIITEWWPSRCNLWNHQATEATEIF